MGRKNPSPCFHRTFGTTNPPLCVRVFGMSTLNHENTNTQGVTSLEAAEVGAFGGESFIFWRAQITAYPVLVDVIDNELITQTVRSNEKRHGFIGGTIFFGNAAVVGLDDNVELLPFDVGLL